MYSEAPGLEDLRLQGRQRLSVAAERGSATLSANQLPLEDGTRLDRVVGRERDVDVAAGHPDRQRRLDVHAGLAERLGCLGERTRAIGERRGHELDRVVLPLALGEGLPGPGIVCGDEHDRAAVAAGRPAEAGDVDALGADGLGHLAKLAGLVLEVHDERIHTGTSVVMPTRATD